MNTTIATMQARGSIRKYNPQKTIPQNSIDAIIKAAQQSPTYICGQQYSIILIDDKDKKEKLVQLTMPSSGKPMSFIQEAPIFLLFVIDFHKINTILEEEKTTMKITEYLESLFISSVDIGIALEAATVAVESCGLSTVAIGAVRKSTKEIIELFSLPQYTFPLVGLCIGYADENTPTRPKPRLPITTYLHKNAYSLNGFREELQEYNQKMCTFYNNNSFTWTHFIANYYGKEYWTNLSSIYKEQGFNIK
ncbi:MAG: nitroreductase family protein [Desulfovibrionaceae bacterium]